MNKERTKKACSLLFVLCLLAFLSFWCGEIRVVQADISTKDIVSVRIHYLLEDGTEVFDDYVARIMRGSSFSVNVPSPTCVGYEPKILVNGVYEDAKTVALNYTNLTTDQELTVVFMPADVRYVARYFLENIYNDLYTESLDYIFEDVGLTGSYPKDKIEIDIPGFTKLYHIPEVIAADGSTEFHLYYSRNLYVYQFDNNGGFGTDSVFEKFGTRLNIPDPERPGYVFDGWDLRDENGNYDGVADALPTTMQIGDRTYSALWKAVETTYTVNYWWDFPTNPDDEFVGSETRTALSGTVIDDFTVFQISNNVVPTYYVYLEMDVDKTKQKNPSSVIVAGDGTTIINVYYVSKEYTIKYYYAMQNGTTYYISTNTAAASASGGSPYGTTLWGQRVSSKPTLTTEAAQLYTEKSEVVNGLTYYYIEMTARYRDSIIDRWPAFPVGTVNNGTTVYEMVSWSTQAGTGYNNNNNNNKNIKGPFARMSSDLIADPNNSLAQFMVAYWNTDANISDWTYNIYVTLLDGETADVTKDGVGYKLLLSAASKSFYTNGLSDQTALSIEGFVYTGTTDGSTTSDPKVVNFYYTRGVRAYSFSSAGQIVQTTDMSYGSSLVNTQPATLDYPSTLESGAYEFDGWYYAPDGEGDKIDFATITATMPEHQLTIFANWVKVQHTVTFSDTFTEMENQVYTKELSVTHGESLATSDVPDADESKVGTGVFDFVGWFYIDENGTKQAFNTEELPVTKDMHLFADWQSGTAVPYRVRYKFTDSSGQSTEIGTESTGYAYAGMTKTFTAKAGTELETNYQQHYYPTTNSHSILLTADVEVNEYEFEYVNLPSVQYTVQYLDIATGTELATSKIVQTEDSVITEKFKAISGYIPDAFQKRLVLSADEDQNVIKFYYTKNTTNAFYNVTHMIEELDGSYTEYASIDGIGTIGDTLPVQEPLTIIGFTYSQSLTQANNGSAVTVSADGVTGTVTLDGLQMFVYYTRNSYTYTVRYVEYGNTSHELKDAKTGQGKYEEVVTIDFSDTPTITSSFGTVYERVSDATRTLTIAPINTQEVLGLYNARTVDIVYVAVSTFQGATDFGSLSLLSEQVASTNNITGSTPTPAAGYRFVGWYTDAACTTPVDASLVDANNKLTPIDLSKDISYYYALFEPVIGELTISRSGIETSDSASSSIYHVVGTAGTITESIDQYVTVTGNSSVTLVSMPLGTYTITDLTDWSWKYTSSAASQSAEVAANTNTTVNFSYTKKNKAWLGEENKSSNQFSN